MISIIIRAKNEMPWIKYTLQMLRLQNRQDFEVIAVDSGSTDGSYEYLQDFKPDVLYQIKPEEYIPGKVLNEAIRQSKGEIIVFNNADCIPQHKQWLQNLIRPLEDPGNVEPAAAAAFCQQIPRPNASPLVRKDYERAFGDGNIHSGWRHFFSLASSAVTREAITKHPFNPDIQYSEDIEWSWRMKRLGYKIAYVPDAIVEHSHDYSLKGIAKRFKGEGKAEKYIYRELYESEAGLWQKESSLLRAVILPAGAETLRDALYLLQSREYDWIPKAPLYRFLQRYYTYVGRTQ
jgi:rhamnosyltransferase